MRRIQLPILGVIVIFYLFTHLMTAATSNKNSIYNEITQGSPNTAVFFSELYVENEYYIKGLEFYTFEDYGNAEKFLLLAIDELETSRGANDIDTSKVKMALGSLYLDSGNFEESYNLLNSAYISFANEYGSEHIYTVFAKGLIGRYDISTGEFDRGIREMQAVLEAADNFYIQLSISTAMAETFQAEGRYEDAIALYHAVLGDYYEMLTFRHSIEVFIDSEAEFPKRDRFVLLILNNLGLAYTIIFDADRAIECLEAAIDIWHEFEKEEDLDIALVYKNYSNALYTQNNLEHTSESIEYLKKAFDIHKKLLPENSVLLALSYINVSNLHGLADDRATRLEHLEKALQILSESVGENHIHTAGAHTLLGDYFVDTGDPVSALESYRKTESIYKSLLMFNSLDLSHTYDAIAAVYFDSGDFDNAREYYTASLRIIERSYGDVGWYLYNSHRSIGFTESRLGNFDEALEQYAKSQAIMDSRIDDPAGWNTSPEAMYSTYSTLLNNIAAVYEDMGDYLTAKDYQIRAYYMLVDNGISLEGRDRLVERLHRLHKNLDPEIDFVEWLKGN
jgi:tetratricopeptide (TPR) repeat protein